jgi:hypothetical protein
VTLPFSRVLVVLACALPSCGYRAVYGGEPSQRLHVRLVRTLVPDAVASDEVASGVREELARDGALEPGDGWPRVEVEVLRADEESEGVAADVSGELPGASGAGRSAPVARGVDVGIVARAWIVAAPGAAPERDTGDMRAADVVAVDRAADGALDPRAAAFHQADARRAAARRLGSKLGRKILGAPAVSEEQDR